MVALRNVAIVFAFVAGACGTAQPTTTPPPAVVLTDANAGFSISVPRDWSVVDGTSPSARDDYQKLAQQHPNLKPVLGALSDFSYAAFDLTDASSALPSTLIAQRNTNVSFGMGQSLGFMGYAVQVAGGTVVAYDDVPVGRYDGKRLVLETPARDGQTPAMRMTIVGVDRGTYWYSVTLIADPASAKRTDAQLAEIVSTFRLTDASVPTLPAGTLPPVVPMTMRPTASPSGFVVRGRIRSASGAVEGQVRAYRGGTAACCTQTGFASTEEDGTFELRLSAGAHRLLFIPTFSATTSAARVSSEWWNDAEDFAHAADLEVTSDRSGIDVTLRPRAKITGRVVYEPTGAPIAGFGVLTYFGPDVGNIAAWWVQTDADGRFTVQVPAGTYRLNFQKVGYLERWWDHAIDYRSATAVTVTADGTVELLHAIPAPSR